MKAMLGVAALAVLVGCPAAAQKRPQTQAKTAAGGVVPGIEVFLEKVPPELVGKRIGLITNQTGIDRQRRSDIDLLYHSGKVKLVALFAAEHGIRGVLPPGGQVGDEKDPETGLTVFSIFGGTNAPTPKMLEGVDALVYDMQDLGVRQYTTESTLLLSMEAAKRKGIPFVVLDRPDPVTGDIVEGNILAPKFASFIGIGPVASRPGMTVGELARFYNATQKVGAELIVIPMKGWRRSMWLDQTGLPWVKTSPNIPRFEAAIDYPGTVFFEATNIAEGRGSDFPFEQAGAPWMNAREVAARMTALKLPGVRFEARDYPIKAGYEKYPGQMVHGVRLIVTDRATYRPIRTCLLMIDVIRRLQPAEFRWYAPAAHALERHAGTDQLRKAYENGTLPALLDEWDREAARFARERQPYLLYK